MLPGPTVIWQAVLFGLGVGWCAFIIRRLPADLAELSRTFQHYRASRNPHVLGTIKDKEGRRERFRSECAKEFWTTLAVQLLFFWPITALALAAIIWFVWGLWCRITGAL